MDQLHERAGVSASGEGSFYRPLENPESSPQLLRDLRRHGVKLYGTRWCLNCRQQKAMLYQLADRNQWKDMYVDCDLLLNSLETAYIKQVPAWKVGNEFHLGMQSEESLRSLVDKVAGQKKLWKTGGAAQWERRHRQRAGWAKQEYAILVKEAIARGKEAAAADKATRRISRQTEETHPPQPLPSSAPVRRPANTALGVTVLRTPMGQTGLQIEPVTVQSPAALQIMPRPSATVSLPKLTDPVMTSSQPFERARQFVSASRRDQLRQRSTPFSALQERFPVLAGLRDRQIRNPVRAVQDRMREAQAAGQLAPVGWFRERFTDADYGQLFETVAKIRLLALPQLFALPRLVKPTFARASSAVEPAGFAINRQGAQEYPKDEEQKTGSWLQQDGRRPGGAAPPKLLGARIELEADGSSSGKGVKRLDNARRPWWRTLFSR